MTDHSGLERLRYLRDIRRGLLEKLGLPVDTPPEAFQAALQEAEKKKALAGQSGRIRFLRQIRKKLLASQGLPEDTPPADVNTLLKMKKTIRRLNELAEKDDEGRE